MSKASALIYTREKYIGFPGEWFKVQPEDFPEKVAKNVLNYAMSAMEDVKPLRSAHEQVRVVVAKDGYVVLGVAAFLRDMFSDGWEGKDEANRLGYGFFGYVWKQEEFTQNVQFPALESYAALVTEYIRPNWEILPNSRWAAHQELVPYQYTPCNINNVPANYFVPSCIESVENEERLLQWAIQKASNGESVSVCTNVTIYNAKDYKTPFQYVSQAAADEISSVAIISKQNAGSTVISSNGHTDEKGSEDFAKSTSISGDSHSDDRALACQVKKTGETRINTLIAVGVGLFILTTLPLPVVVLRVILLVVATVCITVGIVNIVLKRKPQAEASALKPLTNPNGEKSNDIKSFKAGKNASEEPARPIIKKGNQKSEVTCKPKKETTEDLFKF